MIRPTLPVTERLAIITADIFAWRPPRGSRYDVIWFDIWPDIAPTRLPEMARLHRRFAAFLGRGNPRRWMESWHRRETRRLAATSSRRATTAMAERETLMLSWLWMRRIGSPKNGATEATSTFGDSVTA